MTERTITIGTAEHKAALRYATQGGMFEWSAEKRQQLDDLRGLLEMSGEIVCAVSPETGRASPLSALSEASERERSSSKSPKETRDAVIEAVTEYLRIWDSEPIKDHWDTESGREEPGARKFASDWSIDDHHKKQHAAREKMRAVLKSSPVSAEGGESDADYLRRAQDCSNYDPNVTIGAPADIGERSLDDRELCQQAARWALCKHAGGAGPGRCTDDCNCVAEAAVASDAVLSALSKGAEAPGSKDDWQPIETAPKDGTYILIGNAFVATMARWYSNEGTCTPHQEGWLTLGRSNDALSIDPTFWFTHWRPLPTPPQGLEHGSGQ